MRNGLVDVEWRSVLVAGVVRRFVVLTCGTIRSVYELVVNQKNVKAHLVAADPAVVPTVLVAVGRR
jgi:hypothetical protein